MDIKDSKSKIAWHSNSSKTSSSSSTSKDASESGSTFSKATSSSCGRRRAVEMYEAPFGATPYPPKNFPGQLEDGEYWKICPYDKSHRFIRPVEHLLKCRDRYKRQREDAGLTIDIEICRYDWCHHVHCNEMEEHEKYCIDQAAMHSYMMQYNQKRKLAKLARKEAKEKQEGKKKAKKRVKKRAKKKVPDLQDLHID